MTIVRTRDFSSATIGKKIPWAKTPDITSHHTERLGHGADLDVPVVLQPEMVHGPPAVLPHDSRGVRVVDHGDGVELAAQGPYRLEVRDVAVHREDPVGHD